MKSKQQNTNLIERINRIEGQIRGLRQMIEKERPCFDILKQISAARGALRSLGQIILNEHLEACISSIGHDNKKTKELKDNLVLLFSKMCSKE